MGASAWHANSLGPTIFETMKIVLFGHGKMGQLIEKLALNAGHEVVLIVDEHNRAGLTTAPLQLADVAIEFSTPDSAPANIRLCADAGLPVVVGTTGWYAHFDEISAYVKQKESALLPATNFSLGVNLFFAMTEKLGALMQAHTQYQARIEETHHVHKKDAPSGTAITAAERLLSEWKHASNWSLDGIIPHSLPVIAHRIDEVPGTHEVIFSNTVDEIRLTHTAFNREGFASGALYAAQWLVGKKGVFSMRDVLGV